MEILKYEKKGNGNYLIYLSDGTKYKINEEIILKHKLLYKKEIDEFLLEEIINENNDYDIYNKCVKYIMVRLRSEYEICEYMKRQKVSLNLIEEVVAKLKKNNLINDEIFVKAFINDKKRFTSMGPNRITSELEKNNIDKDIIVKYISQINENELHEKLDKQITKIIKSHKGKPNLKNKLINNLINLGYSYDLIVEKINKYDL